MPNCKTQARPRSLADLIICGLGAVIVIGIVWGLATARDEHPPDPVYAMCEPCGLTRVEIDELRGVVAETVDSLPRTTALTFFQHSSCHLPGLLRCFRHHS